MMADGNLSIRYDGPQLLIVMLSSSFDAPKLQRCIPRVDTINARVSPFPFLIFWLSFAKIDPRMDLSMIPHRSPW